MPTVTFFLGLCGSGKTYHSEKRTDKTGAELFESAIRKKTEGELRQCLMDGRNCVVEEIWYCDKPTRVDILHCLGDVPNLRVEWFCLENDLETANWNVHHRKNKGDVLHHLKVNCDAYRCYVYPEGVVIEPIYRIQPE